MDLQDFTKLAMISTFAAIGFFVQVQCAFATSSVVLGDTSRCPAHLSKVEHSITAVHDHVCYLFVDDEVFWKRARDECYELGGDMLTIEDETAMRFIAETLHSKELNWDREGVWLGARYKSGGFRWTNGRRLSYSNWASGEPSRVLGFLLTVEGCVQMRKDSEWRWHDCPCGSLGFKYNFICQFPLSKPSDKEGQIAPSATNREKDNGNNSTLVIIIVLGMSILLFILVTALLLHVYHRHNKRQHAEMAALYVNNHGSSPASNSTSNNLPVSGSGSGVNGNDTGSQQTSQSSATSSASGATTRVMTVPTGLPPLPPSDDTTPFLYSELYYDFSPRL